MVRYSLLRVLIFFGCLSLLWLLGLQDSGERPWLVVGAALLSMVISYFALRPFREETVAAFAQRVDHRLAAKAAVVTDEDIEDSALTEDPDSTFR